MPPKTRKDYMFKSRGEMRSGEFCKKCKQLTTFITVKMVEPCKDKKFLWWVTEKAHSYCNWIVSDERCVRCNWRRSVYIEHAENYEAKVKDGIVEPDTVSEPPMV